MAFLVSTKQDFPWPVVLRHNWQCQKKNNNYGMLMVTDVPKKPCLYTSICDSMQKSQSVNLLLLDQKEKTNKTKTIIMMRVLFNDN